MKQFRRAVLGTAAAMLAAGMILSCGTAEGTEDRELFRPQNFTGETLSETEKELNEYLIEMKREADALPGNQADYGNPNTDRAATAGTALYQFVSELPKGGELHAHECTLISFERFLEILRDKTMICLEAGDQYGYLYARNNPNLPETAVPLDQALREGQIGEKELYDLLVVSGEDADFGYWNHLNHSFAITGGLKTDPELLTAIYEQGFRYAQEIGLELVELRVSFKPEEEVNLATLEPIREAYYRVRREFADFRVRVVALGGKGLKYTVEFAEDALREGIRLSKTFLDEFDPEHPETFIVALDLVNEEDTGRPLSEYADFFLSEEVKESGLKVYLHCGESLRMDNESVIDAYLYGAARVGHGLNLYRFPELTEKYKEQNIAMEICPMSNHLLGYVKDLRLHPAAYYLRKGIPIVLCSDDGLYMTGQPLVDDWYAAVVSWDLTLGEIKEICRNSIVYSSLSETEKARMMQVWEKQWDDFCQRQLEAFRTKAAETAA